MAQLSWQQKTVKNLQESLDKIDQWIIDWKIKLKEIKSYQVTFALRHRNSSIRIYLNGIPVPQEESAKYLGFHLD